MFKVISKKLADEALVNAVEVLQDNKSTKSKKNEAFSDLRDTFQGLILKKFNSVKNVASNKSEMDEIRHHIESIFVEAIMGIKPASGKTKLEPGIIVSYINTIFQTRINVHMMKILLGKTEIIGDIANYKIQFKNGLKKFYKEYHRMPDFNKIDLDNIEDEEENTDLTKMAEIMKVSEDQVAEILKLFGENTIQSMSREVAGDGEDSTLVLMDTLHSNEPLPDEVFKNKEIIRVLTKEIKKLPENQQKVLMMYYHPDNPKAEDLTSDEIAKKLDEKERNVRNWIALGKEQIRKSPELKEMYTASLANKFIKFAIAKYKTSEDLLFEVIAECKK